MRAFGGIPLSGADVVDAPTSSLRVTGATGVASALALDVTLRSLLARPDQGLVSATAPVLTLGSLAPLSLTVLGAVRTDASATIQPVRVQDGRGATLAVVTADNALKVDASATTQPISGRLTALQGDPPWTMIGTGTPGWPSPGVLTIQGSVGGSPVPVTGRVGVWGAVDQGTPAPSVNGWPVVPAQATSLNSTATSTSNAPQTLMLSNASRHRIAIRAIVCYLSATGSATLTVSDGGTVVLDLGAFTGLVTGAFTFLLPTGVWGAPGNPMTVNVGAGGGGVTSTCSVVADRS